MHLVGWLRGDLARKGLTDQLLSEIALASGVVTTPLSSYRLKRRGREIRSATARDGALLFGYSGFSEAAIWKGARQLEHAFAAAPRSSLRLKGS
jgi:DNA-binding transcriptional MocR family regulator